MMWEIGIHIPPSHKQTGHEIMVLTPSLHLSPGFRHGRGVSTAGWAARAQLHLVILILLLAIGKGLRQ